MHEEIDDGQTRNERFGWPVPRRIEVLFDQFDPGRREDSIVLVTGGSPALFAYNSELMADRSTSDPPA